MILDFANKRELFQMAVWAFMAGAGFGGLVGFWLALTFGVRDRR